MQRERVQISLRRRLFSGGVGRKLASGAYIVACCGDGGSHPVRCRRPMDGR
ncbi:hypothetical protein [Nitrosomonas communis]|uniref:hypothetical protein n=1 Tax=Nitrosomonas communis TaxID=44574 RepID=UPI00147F8EE5|nr:hypothetical protein [Nitrosomonas communis]